MDTDYGDDSPLTIEMAPARAAEFLAALPPYPGGFAGRGVVICAGGATYCTCAWVLVNRLRQLGCRLPIEVWYLGPEEGDPAWIKLVEPLGVNCIDAFRVQAARQHPRLNGWESKAFAILHCRFEEVLFLDADNVPVIDPTFLFETPEFRATGAIFWPDCGSAGPDREAWRIFDVPFREEWEQESGQILLDKRRCWPALCLCDWYNRHSEFYYRFVYGDKDTFRLAWHRAGEVYAMPEKLAWESFFIRQGDFAGKLVFQHRSGDKWSLHGNRHCPGFQYEAECNQLVRSLAAQWNPALYAMRNLSPGDRLQMSRMAGQRYQFFSQRENSWTIRLVENGKIAGHGRKERYWWCDDGHLVFSKLDGRPNLVLSQGMEGGWHGYSHDYGHVSLRAARLRIRRVRGAQERSAFRGYGGPKILNGTEPTLTPCLA